MHGVDKCVVDRPLRASGNDRQRENFECPTFLVDRHDAAVRVVHVAEYCMTKILCQAV